MALRRRRQKSVVGRRFFAAEIEASKPGSWRFRAVFACPESFCWVFAHTEEISVEDSACHALKARSQHAAGPTIFFVVPSLARRAFCQQSDIIADCNGAKGINHALADENGGVAACNKYHGATDLCRANPARAATGLGRGADQGADAGKEKPHTRPTENGHASRSHRPARPS